MQFGEYSTLIITEVRYNRLHSVPPGAPYQKQEI